MNKVLNRPVSRVDRFVEKPNLSTAEEYLSEGGYFWNAGMFVWRPSVILSAIEKHAPVLSAGLKELQADFTSTGSLLGAMEKVYPKTGENFRRFCRYGKSGGGSHVGV